jgi:hypothetical protein
MNKLLTISFLTFVSNFAISQESRYRFILPPAPPAPPTLNNTVKTQISNQNINFNTGSSSSIGGGFGGGGFQQNTGGIQGTAQYTQNNTPGMQISQLYQIPLSTGGGVMNSGGQFGGGQFGGGQFGGGQFGGGQFGGGQFGGGQFGGGQFGGGQFGGGQFGGGQFGGGQFGGGQFGQGGGVGQFGGTGGQAVGMNNPFYQMAMQGIISGVGGSAFQSGGGGQFGGGQFGGGFNNGGNGL